MLPDDQVRFLVGIVLSIPLSLILRFIPGLSARRYFSLITSTALQYYVYSNELFLALLMHVLIYFLIMAKGRQCGFFITSISILLLSFYHSYRMYAYYGSELIDLSMILMLHVSKYSLFAFSYQDGGVSVDQLKQKYQKQDRIVNLPSFIDFISYLQFVPACIINTPLDYNKYDRYLKQQGSFANIPLQESMIKFLKDLGIGVICGLFFLAHILYFPIGAMKDQHFLDHHSSLYILHYSFWSIWLIKFKFYVAWKLSMLSIHCSGVSYQPIEKGDNFLGIQTCNPYQIQTTIHIREKIGNWNIAVQQWLRKCVYDRVNTSKGTAQLITFLVSAFWHGMYGGYYLTFLLWFMQLYASGLMFKFSERKEHSIMVIYQKFKPYSFWIIWIIWNWYFAFHGMFFHLLKADLGFQYLAYLNFIPNIIVIVLIIIFTLIPKKKSSSKTSQGKEKVAKTAQSNKEENKLGKKDQ